MGHLVRNLCAVALHSISDFSRLSSQHKTASRTPKATNAVSATDAPKRKVPAPAEGHAEKPKKHKKSLAPSAIEGRLLSLEDSLGDIYCRT